MRGKGEHGVVMKAAPAAIFVVAKVEFLPEILISHVRSASAAWSNRPDRGAWCFQAARGEPVFGWHRRPLFVRSDTMPRVGAGAVVIAMRGPDTHGCKVGDELGYWCLRAS